MMVAVFIRYWPTKAERAARIVRKDIDGQLKPWRYVMLLLAGVICFNAFNLSRALCDPDTDGGFLIGCFCFMVCIFSVIVVFGPGCAFESYREGRA
jgi:hypothetical protein